MVPKCIGANRILPLHDTSNVTKHCRKRGPTRCKVDLTIINKVVIS